MQVQSQHVKSGSRIKFRDSYYGVLVSLAHNSLVHLVCAEMTKGGDMIDITPRIIILQLHQRFELEVIQPPDEDWKMEVIQNSREELIALG